MSALACQRLYNLVKDQGHRNWNDAAFLYHLSCGRYDLFSVFLDVCLLSLDNPYGCIKLADALIDLPEMKSIYGKPDGGRKTSGRLKIDQVSSCQ